MELVVTPVYCDVGSLVRPLSLYTSLSVCPSLSICLSLSLSLSPLLFLSVCLSLCHTVIQFPKRHSAESPTRR